MKFIKDKKYYIISILILGMLFVEIFCFPLDFFHLIILGLVKIVFAVAVIIIILAFEKGWLRKLLLTLIVLIIICLSYIIPLWKVYANIYINSRSKEYLTIYHIVKKDSNLIYIMYDSRDDSLDLVGNKNVYSKSDIKTIKQFMKKSGLELWKDEYGLAFIYERFIDNRSGILYCPDSSNCAKIDTTYFRYKLYQKIINHWYRYGAG